MPGTLLVSLDFELFWGMQDCVPLENYADHVLGGREAIPKLLSLFEKHGIHATWATVGFQFASGPQELAQYLPASRPCYADGKLSTYRLLPELKEGAPCFFSPELIARVAHTQGQEIGSHTFSHYYCREDGQTPQQFRADMLAAKAIAEAHGYCLTSAVFPRNQSEPEYTAILRELGFTAYRSEEEDWIHRIRFVPLKRALRLVDVYFPLTGYSGGQPKVEDSIVKLPGCRMFKPYFPALRFLERLKLRRIRREMRCAAQKGLTFHLWWHPHNIGVRTQLHLEQLESLFSYYDELREKYGMRSLNMGEAAQELLHREENGGAAKKK